MKLIWLWLFFGLMIILIPGLLSIGIRRIPSGFQPSLTNAQSINKDIVVQQSLKAKNNLFSGIGLSIKNPYSRNSQDLTFDLLDQQNQLIRTVKISGKNITDGNFVIISFDPVVNSENKFYTFRLSASETTQAEALEIYHSQQSPDDGGVYVVNNEQKEGQLSFISYYSPRNTIANLILIYRNWFYKFFQDLPFAIFYLLTFLLGVGIFIKELSKKLR